jgi:DNA-directed RNA polymerase specialized sigma24 family protein
VDTELVMRAQRGDRAAFGLLAADIATRFLAVSRRILRDIDLAEDATQQALAMAYGLVGEDEGRVGETQSLLHGGLAFAGVLGPARDRGA